MRAINVIVYQAINTKQQTTQILIECDMTIPYDANRISGSIQTVSK